MKRILFFTTLVGSIAVLVPSAPVLAQSTRPSGRVLFMVDGLSATDQGRALKGFREVVTSFSFSSPFLEKGGTEYKFDLRTAAYPSSVGRDTRISMYDAYVGRRMAGGNVNVRVGQMWLNDLGGLGSVGGVLVEVSRPNVAGFKRLRIGGFGGLEPKILQTGFVTNVRKVGGYVALDGEGARRHVVGLVLLRNSGLTERAVLTTTNFVPIGKSVFIYQAAEFDLSGPAGKGTGGLTYFFTNARISPSSRVEIQATFHRGRSIDTRTITLDQLNGRPVAARALEGMLYESAQGRITVTLFKGFRAFGGYAQDRNNRDESATGRTNFGLFATNLAGSGLDIRLSDNRIHRSNSDYDAWDASVGRNLTSKVYLSFDFSSSLAVLQVTSLGGFLIESRPRTTRYAVSGLFNVTRRVSLMVTGERLRDGTLSEFRWLSGLTYRF